MSLTSPNFAEQLFLDASHPPAFANPNKFQLGTNRTPNGHELYATGISIVEDGKPIVPVMGEFHYSRYPKAEWRDELLKMKAGGVTIVASYVFWIHHEETEGKWTWSGDRDLRAFVQLCGELDLKCIIRCGPWDHGEVRNGGFPEWLLDKDFKLRTDDEGYLQAVSKLYGQIGEQLRGCLWKDGGPVIGVQIENEYAGRAEHLMRLRQMAIDAGLDVPLYTRTGWPELQGHLEFGALLPLYGGYAEGFWDRALTTMPWRYWKEFAFKIVRTDTAIASEHFGSREARDEPDVAKYPYLTCELGSGMTSSYHRRINVFPMDALSILMVKLGSGSNLPGYYVYHGGTNPTGIEPQLQEHQATRYTNYNDLPIKTYDFQTALGEFGQIREQYHLLRPVHLFLRDFGDRLARMPTVLPGVEVTQSDTQTLRYGVRTDGHSGFVFINNYQRLLPMPAKQQTQFQIKLRDGEVRFPSEPTTVSADAAFFWPFNFDLGDGATLSYATAQPVCQLETDDARYSLFASTGNPAEFSIDGGEATIEASGARMQGNRVLLKDVEPGRSAFATIKAKQGKPHRLLFLSPADAKSLYKGRIAGREYLVLADDGVVFDNDRLRLTTTSEGDQLTVLLLPGTAVRIGDKSVTGQSDGAFVRFVVSSPRGAQIKATVRQLNQAESLRSIPMGIAKVAQEPSLQDYDAAAKWQIKLSEKVDAARRLMLRIHYVGDVAQACLGDRLLTDNFYNGDPFDVGLNRYGNDALNNGITLKILPLQKAAPIYMLDRVRPDLDGSDSVAKVDRVEVIESREVELTLEKHP